MITVSGLYKSYPNRLGRVYVFENASVELPGNARVGLLGRNGAGKSTLIRLLSGAEEADRGQIAIEGSVSWPMGLTPNFHPRLTGRQNVRFVLRINGMAEERIPDNEEWIRDFSELGTAFDDYFGTYSSGMRARLAFTASMCFRFKWLLMDEVMEVGDQFFKDKSRELLEDRTRDSGYILVSHAEERIREWCNCAILIKDKRLWFFDRVNEAIHEHHMNSVISIR